MNREDRTCLAPKLLAAATLAPLLMGSLCGEDLLLDPHFELWCGEALCKWTVDTGTVARTATWHAADSGAELIGDEVALSQLIPGRYECLAFDFMTFHEEGVDLRADLDFFADGMVEVEQKVDGTDWKQTQFRVFAPEVYRDLRLRVVKRGTGRAVLARVKVTTTSTCAGERVEVRDRALGAICGGDSDCASGRCRSPLGGPLSPRTCGECADDGDCASGSCYFDDATRGMALLRCGEPPEKELGRRCLGDGECESGICCAGWCSECCADRLCPRGVCEQQEWGGLLGPFQCNPRRGERLPGEPCLADADCQTSVCEGSAGELEICALDGRLCGDGAGCDEGWLSVCQPIGEKGGRCR